MLEVPKLLNNSDQSIAEEIYVLFQESYSIEAKLIGVEDFPPLKRRTSNIQESKTQFWGMYKNATLAAAVEIEIKDDLLDIHSFVVSPSFFRQGIANKLLSFLLESTQCNKAVVETATANKPAILLYQKFGFIENNRWLTAAGINKLKLTLNFGHKKSDTP